MHTKIKGKLQIITTYLKMLPSSLECDNTLWWRVDDLWWSFLSSWSLPCLTNITSWAVHEHLVSYVALSSFSSFCDAILLFFLLWNLPFCLNLLLHSLFHSYKRLVDNTYPKGCIYRFWRNNIVVIELKVIFYAKEKLVLIF